MENDLYKLLSWQSKFQTLKVLVYLIYCFVLNFHYNWTFSMIFISSLITRLLTSVALAMFQTEEKRREQRGKLH